MSIQEVDQVLGINEYNYLNKTVTVKSNSILKTDTSLAPSPRASFQKFREILRNSNLVVSDMNDNLRSKAYESKEPLTGSKISYKTNCESEIKEEYIKPKLSISPNLRYGLNENQTAISLDENKVIITDQLKLSNSG